MHKYDEESKFFYVLKILNIFDLFNSLILGAMIENLKVFNLAFN